MPQSEFGNHFLDHRCCGNRVRTMLGKKSAAFGCSNVATCTARRLVQCNGNTATTQFVCSDQSGDAGADDHHRTLLASFGVERDSSAKPISERPHVVNSNG